MRELRQRGAEHQQPFPRRRTSLKGLLLPGVARASRFSLTAAGAGGSVCSVEGVADGCWVPALAALGGGDAFVVEGVGDRGQAVAGRSLAPDPLDHVGGDGRGPAEPDALRALVGERLPCPL